MGQKVTFDEITKTINITQAPDGDGETLIDVKQDLYSDGKEDWVANENLRKFEFPIYAVGGNPLPGAKALGSTFFIAADWKIRPYDADHRMTIDGNLYATDGSDPFLDTIGAYTVRIMQEVSALTNSILQEVDFSAYVQAVVDGVWDDDISGRIVPNSAATALKAVTYESSIAIDTVKGVAGTGWPIGTHFQPSNNLDDALIIMGRGNVDKLMLHSALTIEATHIIDGLVVETHGLMGTTITFVTGCSADKTAFRYLDLQGDLTNGDQLLVENCSINDLSNFTGIMNNVAWGQGAEISIGLWATIIQATSGGDPTNEPELNIGTAAVNISSYTGNLKLTGKTGSNRTVVNLTSGNIIIDASCVAGSIQILGTGIIEADNSGPGCQVDLDGFISIDNITTIIQEDLKRVLGLMHENVFIDQPIYDSDGNLEEARVRIYSAAGSVGTDSNVLATYTITAPGEGPGKFISWKQVRV